MDRNQAFVDPEAIEEAAKSLEQSMMRIRDFDNRLGHELDRLGLTFQDEEYDQFRAAFEATRALTVQFSDDTMGMIPRFREDAEKIRTAQSLKTNA